MDGSEQLAADAEEEDFVRLCARDLGKKAFFEEVDANPRESLVALLIRAYLDILLDILRRPVLMQKAVPVLQDMDALDVLQPYIASKGCTSSIVVTWIEHLPEATFDDPESSCGYMRTETCFCCRKKRLKMMSVFVLSFLVEDSESEKYIATPENVLYLLKVCPDQYSF